MTSVGWRLVRGGSDKGAVLCLNFTVAGVRGQASFVDLASHLSEGYAVWGPAENAWPTGTDQPLTQLEEWLERAGAVDTPVRAVLGFCGTGALATALATRLAGQGGGRAPAVVLFDPIVVGPQNMVDQAEDSLRQLAAIATSGARPDRVETAPVGGLGATDLTDREFGDREFGDRELGELATSLTRHYTAHANAVGAARSVRPATVAALCTRFETYLRYLTLCTIAFSHQRIPPDLLVISRDHEVPAELSGSSLVRLDATQHQLLAQPEAAKAVVQLLDGVLVDGRS